VFLHDKEETIMKHKLTTLLLVLCVPTALASTTWYVNGVTGSNNNNCKTPQTACKTIGRAISHASWGDSIMVASATYAENLTIGKNLTIVGSGASTIIDGGASSSVVTISNGPDVTLSKLTIRNGQASTVVVIGFGVRAIAGGGISNSGTLTLTNSTVSGNSAPIPCIHSFVFCEIRGGTAWGGGIYNSGALIMINSTVSGNHAGGFCNAPCSAFGAGIYNRGTLTMIENSTLTGNGAGISVGTACGTSGFSSCRVGGGAFYTSAGTVTLNNSTVSENSAYRCSGGVCETSDAIVNSSGNLAMNNSTVSGNSAAGICNGGGTATLQNSIVANNSGRNCSGAITSHGYNLSSDGSCPFSNTGDLNNTDPLLGTLGYYGGPTQTIPLLSGSPAIDSGNPSGCTDGLGHLLKTDQRGAPRPNKEDLGGCDMGAYERQGD
jgi:hypothetical protein